MHRRRLPRLRRLFLLPALIIGLGAVSESLAAPTLKRSDFYRYRKWSASLAAVRVDSAQVPLYPLGRPAADLDALDHQAGRLGAAARSVVSMEDILVRDWTRAKDFTSDQSLTTARSYRDIGEFDDALTWYRRSAQRRPDGAPDPALRCEMFRTAVLTGDSLQVTTELLNLLGRASLDSEEESLVLAYRWLLASGDRRNLDHTMEKVVDRLDRLGPRVRFWHAYAEAVRGRREPCLTLLLGLLGEDGATAILRPEQSAWALKTIPDLLYLEGRRDDALRLYAVLAEAAGEGGAWARYQLGNMHLLAGDYAAAGVAYGEFCDEGTPVEAGWRSRACAMATLVARLAELRKEGETYGVDGIHAR